MGGERAEFSIVFTAEGSLAVVALEAKCKDHGPPQQLGIHRPMRSVTGLAAVDAHRRVLEDERAALIGVAFQARLFIELRLVDHARLESAPPGGGESAVRVVAVGALHKSF